MSSFKFFPLILIATSIISSLQEPCIVPDESTSKIQPSDNCLIRNNRIQHAESCEFTCNRTRKVNLFCENGLFKTDEYTPFNINTFCNPNCQLPTLPKYTKTSTSCYKWDFASELCVVYCPFNAKFAELACDKGVLTILRSADLNFIEGLPSVCPYNDCFESPPGFTGEIKNHECVSSTLCYYECSEGLKLRSDAEINSNGFGVITCSEGIWTTTQCERSCGPLPEILNGFYVNRHCNENKQTNQRICEFLCRVDYVAPSHIPVKETDGIMTPYTECKDNGQWETIPRCDENRVCQIYPDFSGVTEFRVTECFLNDHKCHFYCVSGRIDPNSVTQVFHHRNLKQNVRYSGIISCRNGVWEVPQCIPVCETLPSTEINGLDHFDCDENPSSTLRCKYNCKKGYKAKDSKETSSFIDCTFGGWTEAVCVPSTKDEIPPESQCSLPVVDNTVKANKECLHSTAENGVTCYLSCVSGVFIGSDLNEISANCVNGSFQSENILMVSLITTNKLTCCDQNAREMNPSVTNGCTNERVPTEFCKDLNSVINGTVQSDCPLDSPMKTGKKCNLNCPEMKFEGLDCNRVNVVCEKGKLMRLFQIYNRTGTFKEHVTTLTCKKATMSQTYDIKNPTKPSAENTIHLSDMTSPLAKTPVAKDSAEETNEKNETDLTDRQGVLLCSKLEFVVFAILLVIS